MTNETNETNECDGHEPGVVAAIEAGFWIAKDHGKWNVGRDVATIIAKGYNTKAAARAAMVAAHEASRAMVPDARPFLSKLRADSRVQLEDAQRVVLQALVELAIAEARRGRFASCYDTLNRVYGNYGGDEMAVPQVLAGLARTVEAMSDSYERWQTEAAIAEVSRTWSKVIG